MPEHMGIHPLTFKLSGLLYFKILKFMNFDNNKDRLFFLSKTFAETQSGKGTLPQILRIQAPRNQLHLFFEFNGILDV